MNRKNVLDISWETILKVTVALFCFYILYLIKDILILVIFALIISVLFNPAINFLQSRRLSRVLSVILVYVVIFGILGLVIYWTAPVFVSEIQHFSQLFPQYFEKIAPPLEGLGIEAFESMESLTTAFQGWLTKASSSIFSAIGAIFGGITSTFTIFAIALFISLEEKGVEKAVLFLSPKKYEASILTLWKRSQEKVAGWFGARILCCIFIGLASYLILRLFNVNYAFGLSLFAGIMDIIPILGPILAGILIVALASLDSWLKALFVLIAFILIQQIEGNVLTPILTKKFVGLPAALVLIALLVGAKLWGVLGAILAIPVAGILFEFLKDFLSKKKEEETVIL